MFGFLCLCFCCLMGVFGVDADEVKSVSVMKGHSVTLHTHLSHFKNITLIQWKFGPQGPVIAKITTNKTTIYDDVLDGMFRDRLQVDDQTGSLTITNFTTQHSGLYQMTISGKQKTSYTFSVTVYEASLTIVIYCFVVGSLMIVAALLIFYIWRKNTNTQQVLEAVQSGEEITYADPTFKKRQAHQARAEVEDEVMYASVNKVR
ncbi:hypothetical protein E1301_Tti013481 [Triplophysa tibetana]|uniref:Immunoglobulin domain-containing protein n=1 Tax=Triplophysa tibetana TaxID=1572043 RepID=A0A5A9NSJ7_9TELE|nr:hypothetical protein E1301_Tti013481 [Triplophysa tibetana]